MAIAWLHHLYGRDLLQLRLPFLDLVPRDRVRRLVSAIESGFSWPLTSSCGRLFDAVAALLGLRLRTSYEGQAAMELEALAEDAGEPLVPQSSQEVDDVVRDVVEGIARGRKRSSIAAAFHLGLARVLAKAATSVSREAGLSRVALGGGSFQNRILQLQTEGSVSAMRCCVFRRT